jgi:nickel-dependent lactate racemase
MTIETVWNAWEEQPCALAMPGGWNVDHYLLPSAEALDPAIQADRIRLALCAPALQSRLSEPGQTVCIVVDDCTRPAAWGPVLQILLDGLERFGVSAGRVTLLIGLAGHAVLTRQELGWKLGAQVMERVRVVQHDLLAGCQSIEIAGKPVLLNRHYLAAGVKIALGTILPHPFAGFSGGGKAVMPGVAGLETIQRNHALLSFGHGRVYETNHIIRRQMDDIAEASGLDLLINVVVNGQREIVEMVAGPLRSTFEAGLAFARRYTASPLQAPPDVLILNAYPKDRELLQVSNALNVARTLDKAQTTHCKALVLIARLAGGIGHHAVFGPGGKMYKLSGAPSGWQDKSLMFYSPGVTPEEFHQVFSRDWVFCSEWEEVTRRLGGILPGGGLAACYHQASMQTAKSASRE